MDATAAGALIGGGSALAGVVITLVAGGIQDGARRRHESRRADADRAERLALATLERKERLYGTFMIAAQDAGKLQWDALLNVEPVAVSPANTAAFQESTHLLSSLKLVAPAAVISAAVNWWMALMESTSWAMEIGPRTDRTHPAADELYDRNSELWGHLLECERDFMVAARADLGVTDPLPHEDAPEWSMLADPSKNGGAPPL